MSDKVISLIPARGGSKGVPDKNIKPIAGKPLLYWCLKATMDCKEIDEIWVATDSPKIEKVVRDIFEDEICIFHRSLESATDTAPTEIVMEEFSREHDFSKLFLIQATNPLLKSADLAEALTILDSGGYASIVSVVKMCRFFWGEAINKTGVALNYEPQRRQRRQDFNNAYFCENGAFYLTTWEAWGNSHCRISGKVGLLEMSDDTVYEIDTVDDWITVEKLLQKRLANGYSV